MPRVHLRNEELAFLIALLDYQINHDGPDTDGYIYATPDPDSPLLDEAEHNELLSRFHQKFNPIDGNNGK